MKLGIIGKGEREREGLFTAEFLSLSRGDSRITFALVHAARARFDRGAL